MDRSLFNHVHRAAPHGVEHAPNRTRQAADINCSPLFFALYDC
jgi:hypothetical protein